MIRALPIDSIVVDHKLQQRESSSTEAIEDYAEAIRSGKELPPVTVYRVGEQYLLVDGFHRVPAHVEAGRVSIQAEVIEGSRRDAEWHSTSCNASHGLRLSNRDKRKKVKRALQMEPVWSNRAIAEHCGVSDRFVGNVRSETLSTANRSQSPIRIGADGRTYDTTKLSKPASDNEPLVDPPEEHDDDPQDDDETALLQSEVDELAEPYKRAVNDLLRIKRDMTEAAEDEIHGAHICRSITRIATEIDGLRGCIRQLEPLKFCHHCMSEGCDKCSETGFLTRMLVEGRER